jgi:hypothetical protein
MKPRFAAAQPMPSLPAQRQKALLPARYEVRTQFGNLVGELWTNEANLLLKYVVNFPLGTLEASLVEE